MGGTGADVLSLLAGGNASGEEGNDSLYGSSAADTLSGGADLDYLAGSYGADNLAGEAGADTLDGGDGADVLDGGTQDDLLIGNAGNDTLDGGAGYDIARYYGTRAQYTISSDGAGGFFVVDNFPENGDQGFDHIVNVELLRFDDMDFAPSAANTGIVFDGNASNDLINGTSGDDSLRGFGGNDTINGLDGADTLDGMNGADSLVGGAGNDVLDGGDGNDTMAGGLGDDLIRVHNRGDVVVELVGEGTDTVESSVSYTLTGGAAIEVLTAANAVGPVNLTGNGFAQQLIGNGGINLLDGGAGADTMIGGGGNDTYIVDDAGDVVTEAVGGGYDGVRAKTNSYMLGAEVELLTFIGVGNFSGTGNASTNVITGGAGNDTLDGAGGTDVLVGGLGDDTYKVDTAGDQTVEQIGQGIDTVLSTAAMTALSANLEHLQFVGIGNFKGFGNALNNQITGGAGNDTLDGGVGADTLTGGLGDDVYFIDSASDVINEAVGGGADRILTRLSTATAADNVEGLIYYGPGTFEGFANATGTSLFGAGGNDTLTGAAGADRLAGMGGNDVLTGNGGADLFYFDAPGLGIDQITDFQIGVDHIELRATQFGVVSLADLGFASGIAPAASDGRPTMLYDTATGSLYFDATGNDPGDRVQIAVLTGTPALTLNDFVIA
ncbi:hypothetical protein DBR21_11985 [Caulobacter sp. HMWF009]|nr:hypothetical protein DBR21_11985 [Caulobacter sp. HMWF009]